MMKFFSHSHFETLQRFRNLHRVVALIVIVLITLFNALQAQAQSGIELENVGATVRFGEQITFVATIKASIPIQNAFIVILDELQGTSHVEPLEV